MLEQLRVPIQTAINLLEENHYRYAIIGGIALSVWGFPRATLDIDIKVLVKDLDYQRARTTIKYAFPQATRRNAPKEPLIFSITIEGVIVDFLFTIPGYDELIIDRASEHEIDGIKFWICSAEDLAIQKMVAGRPKDLLDVQTVLDVQWGKLDTNYINDWLIQFADLLGRPELLVDYHRMMDNSAQKHSTS